MPVERFMMIASPSITSAATSVWLTITRSFESSINTLLCQSAIERIIRIHVTGPRVGAERAGARSLTELLREIGLVEQRRDRASECAYVLRRNHQTGAAVDHQLRQPAHGRRYHRSCHKGGL